ncbi:DUF3093 domain-containing protein [Paenibacillus sp. TRM 82003]|uniref:DUF3093 domain-containing protein n=1 Tax=Kineococcus sp. TRM81007 TaxID=2925831 RepID=UPI001F55BC62|nr:DUF3093 domain-containing protein [Kineococcus sp. TRM81007]MCI2240399.1 DUF3093 domain-containing protein [Kineococcus sp. TRM81007]MCI3927425.1 DUF3093 domain-containing protein [Paenibacillus sp. TRM 82003]
MSTTPGPRSAADAGTGAAVWRERWWPAPTTWLAWLPAVAGGALVALPILGPVGAAAGAALGAALAVAVLLSMASTVEVADGHLRAGRARLPLRVVRGVDVVPAAQRRAALGPELDARAHLAIRSWVPTAVRVHLDDPDDPAPYWVVSTRHPQRLADAITRGR